MPYRLPDWSVVCKCKVHVCRNVAVHVHMATLGFPSLSHAIGKVSLGCYLVTALLSIVVSTSSDQLMRKVFFFVCGRVQLWGSIKFSHSWMVESCKRGSSPESFHQSSSHGFALSVALWTCAIIMLEVFITFCMIHSADFLFLWDSFWPAASCSGKQKRKKNWFHCPFWL